jgi:acyl-CoA dehydrogenase
MYHCAWPVTQGYDIVQDVSMLKALTGKSSMRWCRPASSPTAAYLHPRNAIERLWRDAGAAISGGATK